MISGNIFREMAMAVRTSGPTALWYGFAPFLLEAFPYDVSELGTYSQLRELHNEASRPTSRFHGAVTALPSSAWDAAIGACAGGAAAVISMPCDPVKTYLQTHAAGKLKLGTSAQLALFISTGEEAPSEEFSGRGPVIVIPATFLKPPSHIATQAV